MRIQTWILAFGTLVTVQAALLPTAGMAQQAQFERFCRDYADHAVNAANRATQAGCTPHRAFRNDFVADRALHYNWCLRSPEQTVAAGRQSRQQALNTCLAGSPVVARPAKLTLAPGQFGMRAGPIFNNGEAKAKCTAACMLAFDGNWVTTTQGKMSICAARNAAGFGILDTNGRAAGIEAGPIWNQGEVKSKCDAAVKVSRWVENNWITTEQGKMSMCACTGRIQTWK